MSPSPDKPLNQEAADETTLGTGPGIPGTGSGSGGSGSGGLGSGGTGGGSGSGSRGGVAPPIDGITGYEILSEVYRGGQGVVYQAIQKTTRRKVAIKVMREGPFAGARDRARFEREVQILASLNHPGVVTVHDSGTAGGSFYYVMDYIQGYALDAWAAARRRAVGEVLGLFARICDAVNAAHLHGVIHRDLKPANIRVDPAGEPHVLDFGLAKTATSSVTDESSPAVMTVTGHFMGSMPWASPEQAEGMPGKIDIRSDVYSLGVMLYQILTGDFPYQVTGAMQDVLHEIIHTDPTPPSRVRQGLPNEVETIVLKCLAKERDRRYQSAGELARDLRHYLAGEPIDAKRDSALYVLRKTLRRYRVPVAVVTAFMILAMVSLAVTTTLWRKTVSERDRAAQAELEARVAQHSEAEQRREADRQRDVAMAARHEAETERTRANSRAELARRRLYYNQIRLAESEFIGNPLRMRRLLDDCPADLRGWEWRRLRWMADGSTATWQIHKAGPTSVAFDHSGRTLVVGDVEGHLKLIDLTTGKETRTLPVHRAGVVSLAFSPDDSKLAVVTWGGGMFEIDPSSGELLRTFDGASSAGQTLKTLVRTAGTSWGSTAAKALYTQDGRLVVGHMDNTVQILDAGSAEELWGTNGLASRMMDMDCTPDGRWIVTGTMEGDVEVWDAARRVRTHRLNAGSSVVALSDDGRYVLACGMTGPLRVWDVDTGKATLTIKPQRYTFSEADFTPDGGSIVTGCDDGAIRIWNAATGAATGVLRGHSADVVIVSVTPDGRHMVSSSDDGSLKLWDARGGGGDSRQFRAAGSVHCMSVNPKSPLLAAAGRGDTIQTWDLDGDQELPPFVLPGGTMYGLDFSPSGLQMASGDSDGVIRFWEVATRKEMLPPARFPLSVRDVRFSPDGRLLAGACGDGSVRILSASTGSEVIVFKTDALPATHVAFSPDGARVASGTSKGEIRVWSLESRELEQSLAGHQGAVHSLAFAPDGRRLVSGSSDSLVRVWGLGDSREMIALSGHKGPVSAVAFTLDGRQVVSGGEDGVIRIWDPTEREEVHALRGHDAPVMDLRFCTNGALVSAGADGTLRLWPVSPQTAPAP